VGILTDIINQEFDKKRDERQLQMKAFASILPTLKDPSQAAAAWEQLKKAAPKSGHGILDFLKPVLMGAERGAGKLGEALHIPGAEKIEEAGTPKYKQPTPKPGEEGSLYYSEEQMQEREEAAKKRADAQEVEKATKLEQAKLTVQRQAIVQNRKQDADEIAEVTKDQNLSEEQKQLRISEITGRPPEKQTWKSGVVTLPNGNKLPVSYNDKDPSQVMLGDGQMIKLPAGSSPPMSWEDHERSEKDGQKPKDTAAVQEETEYWKTQGLDDEAAHKKALETVHGERVTKDTKAAVNLGKALADRQTAATPSAENPAAMKSAALFELMTGDKPTFGLGKSADRDLYNKARNELLAQLGPADIAAMRSAYRGGSAELTALLKRTGALDAVESAFQYDIANARDASAEVPRSDMRKYNTWKQFVQADFTDNPKLAKLRIAAQTAANQYARIMASSGSGSVTTDGARAHAEELLSAAMANGTFDAALEQMDKEAKNMTKGLGEARDRAQQSIQRLGHPIAPPASVQRPPLSSFEK